MRVRTKARKKCSERRDKNPKVDRQGHELEDPVPTPALSTADAEKELEDRLEELKQHYQQHIQHNHREYLEKLSREAIEWKHSTRGPFMTRNLSPSPVLNLKKDIELMLEEDHGIEDEYLYCIGNWQGRVWEDKRANFTCFRDVASKLREVLDNMEELLHLDGYTADIDDLKDMYRYQY
ncbi:hypothetical protein AAF712_015144 [Marasmius tenuissimus]|uniref:Uncharacterized protein n=1 Tax=Marasmius tenuissimus TaxID=585030 RepID=A0ABR2ZB28_9AGAR